MVHIIDDIIHGPVFNNDPILAALLREADNFSDAALYTTWIVDRRMEYISPTCIDLIGYPQEDFISGGPEFLFKIIEEDAVPSIISHQVECIKRVKDPSFDPKIGVLEKFVTPIRTREGNIRSLICQVQVLLYTKNAEAEYSISLMCDDKINVLAQGAEILQEIKKRHSQVYEHTPFETQIEPMNLVYVTSERIDKKITTREAEVLAHLAKGHSTEEIAIVLGISPHTVETHRKNLLVKLDAKNSAELIKKASKVFWLE